MQKIAILSDIHANLPALEAVLREVEQCGAGRIVFLGDIVGYGASPAECVDRVREHGGECVMGNHDIAIKIVVNESIEKKFAFTALDKFNRLNEINPNLELLKKTFDLDV